MVGKTRQLLVKRGLVYIFTTSLILFLIILNSGKSLALPTECGTGNEYRLIYKTFKVPENSFSGVTYANGIGIAVGWDSTITKNKGYKTIDSGNTWQTINFDAYIAIPITNIKLVDNTYGYFTAVRSDLYKTSDGGTSWSDITGLYNPYLIDFYNQNVGAVVSITGDMNPKNKIFTTNNGGTTWQEHTPGLNYGTQDIWGISIPDNQKGYFVGRGGTVGRSLNINDPNAWQLISSPIIYSNDFLIDVYFVNGNKGWIVGYNSNNKNKILKTIDGGNTWIEISSPSPDLIINKLIFFDDNRGMIIGNEGKLFYTKDGGNNWFLENTGFNIELKDAAYINEYETLIVGDDSIIKRISCEYPENDEIHCTDHVDNDGDGLIDKQDPDCQAIMQPENTFALCTDGKDNDFDYTIDNKDEDCSRNGLSCSNGNQCPSVLTNSYCVDAGTDGIIDTCSSCDGNNGGLCGAIAHDGTQYGVCTGSVFYGCKDQNTVNSQTYDNIGTSGPFRTVCEADITSGTGSDYGGAIIRTATSNIPASYDVYTKCGPISVCSGGAVYPSSGECKETTASFTEVKLRDGTDNDENKVSINHKLAISHTITNGANSPAWAYEAWCFSISYGTHEWKCNDTSTQTNLANYWPGSLYLGATKILQPNLQDTVTKEVNLDCKRNLIGEVIHPGAGQINTNSWNDLYNGFIAGEYSPLNFQSDIITVVECKTNSDCDACGKTGQYCDSSNTCQPRPNGMNCGLNPEQCQCIAGNSPKPSPNLITNPGFEI